MKKFLKIAKRIVLFPFAILAFLIIVAKSAYGAFQDKHHLPFYVKFIVKLQGWAKIGEILMYTEKNGNAKPH